MKSVVFHEFGSPGKVLRIEERPMPEPGPGQVRVRMLLSDIQKATTAAVMATEQGNKAVEAGNRQTEIAAGKLGVALQPAETRSGDALDQPSQVPCQEAPTRQLPLRMALPC